MITNISFQSRNIALCSDGPGQNNYFFMESLNRSPRSSTMLPSLSASIKSLLLPSCCIISSSISTIFDRSGFCLFFLLNRRAQQHHVVFIVFAVKFLIFFPPLRQTKSTSEKFRTNFTGALAGKLYMIYYI